MAETSRPNMNADFAVNVEEHGISFGALTDDEVLLTRLRWQAFEAARLLSAVPSVRQQIKDALVLLPAMQRWAANPLLRSRLACVLVRACSDAESAHQAIELAEQIFSFLSGESDRPAAGGR
ncbi:hypothetical protein [Comamonas sp. MYb396]|uniref:hypothetical protein n=1 Tax=Comamonas sp. MYb396 TaxID=2745302 RepID=UPI0030A10EF6